jgi:hypothetical protein
MLTKHMVKSSQYDSIIQPKCNIAENFQYNRLIVLQTSNEETS